MSAQKKLLAILFVGLLLGLTRSAAADSRLEWTNLPVLSEPLIGGPFMVSISAPDQGGSPAVAYNSTDHEFLVVFEAYRSVIRHEIIAQRVSKTGKLLSNYYVVDGVEPDVAYNPALNQYLIVWRENGPDDIKGKRVSANGSYQGNPFDIFVGPGSQLDPVVAFNNHGSFENYLVVWHEEVSVSNPNHEHNHIFGQRVAGKSKGGDGGGELTGSKIPVAANPYPAGPSTFDPDVAYNLNRNEFLVVYTSDPSFSDNSTAPNINGTRVTAGGQVLVSSDIDSSANAQTKPSVAAYYHNQATPYFVVFEDRWTGGKDIRGWLLDKDAHSISLVHIAVGAGQTRRFPSVASSEGLGGYTVVWAEGNPYDNLDIFGRRVSHAGVTGQPFSFSERGLSAYGFTERQPAVAGGSPVALAVWEEHNYAGIANVIGRLLGYQNLLPLVSR